MSSDRSRQLRRERQALKRRSAVREGRASETQRQQAEAEARREYQNQRRRHIAAFALLAFAAVMAISHLFGHAGVFEPLSPKLADLLIGWPMAMLIAIVGAIVYGK